MSFPSRYDSDDDAVKASMTPRDRGYLHNVLGEDVPIAPPKTNGDQWHEHDPAARAILDQIAAACEQRDEALQEYLKTKPRAARLQSELANHSDRVRTQNQRALKLREALAALRAVPR